MPSFRLSEIAADIGANLAGDADPIITGAAGIEAAGPGDITFIQSSSLLPKLATTRGISTMAARGLRNDSMSAANDAQ